MNKQKDAHSPPNEDAMLDTHNNAQDFSLKSEEELLKAQPKLASTLSPRIERILDSTTY